MPHAKSEVPAPGNTMFGKQGGANVAPKLPRKAVRNELRLWRPCAVLHLVRAPCWKFCLICCMFYRPLYDQGDVTNPLVSTAINALQLMFV